MTSIAEAMQAAFEDQRRTDVCRAYGIERSVVELLGPLTRACAAGVHGLCAGEWVVLTARGPCLCTCHAGGGRG